MNELDLLEIKLKNLQIINRKELIKKIIDYFDYSYKNRKETDNELIIEFIKLLVDFFKLNDFVKGIESRDCYNDPQAGFGSYFPNSLSIEIYLSNIISEYYKIYKNMKPELRKLLLFSKIFITCYHEVEHANQVKMCLESKDNIETLILRNSMNFLSSKELELFLIRKGHNAFELPQIIAKKHELEYESDVDYLINPSERLAEVKSAFVIMSSFINYYSEYPFFKKDIFYYFYDALCDGYTDYKNPTEIFIKKYDNINDWELIKSKSDILTSLEKGAFGLELSGKEKRMIIEKRNYYKNPF